MAGLLVSAPFLTGCDDDDEVVLDPIPENFAMNLSSLNIDWNETEGVVDIEADNNWKAESATPWISVDPDRGEAGKDRMYLSFKDNPYALPRTGSVNVTCGDKSGVVTVTQAGRPSDLVAPVAINLEVESLDYATGEVEMSSMAEDILGNLGLSLAEFGRGVDDDGDLEFFLVDKEGNWIEGGTAGTRCGAWLDKDLKVTHWDGAGYPANACFIEVYGGENPVLVVGRAPGVPDDAEYTIQFGFTPKNDHSRFIIMNLTVVFPKMDLKGELVDTVDLDVAIAPNSEYAITQVPFDAAAVAASLGTSSISNVKVVSYDENGEFVPYTGNNGYWFDTAGNVCSWGEGAGWFFEYHGDDPEADEAALTSWNLGPFPGVSSVSGVSKIGFWYNAKVVMFNIKVTITE